MHKKIIILSTFIGAATLTLLSTVQKSSLGVALTPQSYLVPLLFGALSGMLIGIWYTKSQTYLLKLKADEISFRSMFDNAAVGIVLTDANGKFLNVNPSFCQFTGYTKEELLDKTFLDITHPEDIEHSNQCFDLAKSGKYDHFNLVKRYITKQQEVVWGLTTISIFQIDESPNQFVTVCKDITEQKETEKQLDQIQHFNQVMLDTIDSLVIVMDRSGQIVLFNKACEHLTGYLANEVIGKDVRDLLVPPEMRESVKNVFKSLRAKDFPRSHRHEWLTKNGERRMIEWSNSAIANDQGDIEFIMATGLDITDRLKKETELRRLNSNIQLVLNSAGEGIFGLDIDGNCTFINRAGQEILGYTAEELLGNPIHDLTHHTYADGSHYPGDKCEIRKVIENRTGIRVNDEIMWRKDGTSFPAEYSAYPIIEEDDITGSVVVFRNVTDEHAMVKKMNYLASHDALTGLANRYAFERKLQYVLENTDERHQHTLCYFDLDQFKVVNDTCGHIAGDEMLRQVCTILSKHLRHSDTLGRLGGDEFGLLLEECPLDNAVNIVDELLTAIQDFRFTWDDKTFTVTLSAGMILLDETTPSVGAALSHADTACYAAKESGRNRIHIHRADDEELARRQGEMQWVSRIHEAYEENRFYLRKQKIFSIKGDKVPLERFEFLIGLRDQQGKYVPPGAFLPAAERYNLMPTIDRWVVRTALKWLSETIPDLDSLDFCTINLSGTTLADLHFYEFIIDQLESSNVPPHKLCFEITETAAIADLPRAIQFMTNLKKVGCQFALDDFGSGMSSFAYLKNLPVDIVKIDGTFVRDITVDPVDRAMVEAINKVGHVMGLTTIAEYVEDEAILNSLRQIGVDYAQGYGIGMPEDIKL